MSVFSSSYYSFSTLQKAVEKKPAINRGFTDPITGSLTKEFTGNRDLPLKSLRFFQHGLYWVLSLQCFNQHPRIQ